MILLAIVWQASGQLDGWEKYVSNNISIQHQADAAEREFLLALAVAVFNLARDGVGPGLPWMVAQQLGPARPPLSVIEGGKECR